MSELDRTQPCDCWLQLEYCPVGCNKKRAYLHKIKIKDGRFDSSVFCFDEIGTPVDALQMNVDYEEA